MSPKPNSISLKWFHLLFLILALLLRPHSGFTALTAPGGVEISGQLKTLNFFTMTTGLTPELAENPLARAERGEQVFQNLQRARLKFRLPIQFEEDQNLLFKIDYDQQVAFGSFVSTGDFRLAERWQEERQFFDLSQTFVEEESVRYLHRLYRISARYENRYGNVEIGRQQIPWGKGHFFTPTDIFNPFSPTQIELEERDGVDAIYFTSNEWKGFKGEFVYTPRGKRLHPQRFVGRISHDVVGYEVGILGGGYGKDQIVGFDTEGNLGNAVFRGEGLFQAVDQGRNFFKYTLNVDYNLPHNVLIGGEYYFNGDGKRRPLDYELRRFVRGDIQQMAKNYGAILLRHEVNAVLTVANRFIMNMDDVSFFVRPDIQYEPFENFVLIGAIQLYLGDQRDEFGAGQNLYIMEARYSF